MSYQLITLLPRCSSHQNSCFYFHSFMTGLQKVQKNAASLILKAARTDHTTPHLHTLHWLPINARIKCKISSLYFSAITSTGPVYLSNLFMIYMPFRQLRPSTDTVYCAFHLSRLSRCMFFLFYCSITGTHFQKKLDSLLSYSFRSALKTRRFSTWH